VVKQIFYPNLLWLLLPGALGWISSELVRDAGVFAVANHVLGNVATALFAIALFLCGFYWLVRFVLDCVPLTLTDEGIGLWSLRTPRHKTRIGIQWAHVHSLTLEPDAGFRRSRLGLRLDGRSYVPIVPLGHDSKVVARKIVAVATTNNWRIRVDPTLESWLKA
jgi:hypothetical protein